MKNQFWVGLGSPAVLVKKKFGADYEQILRPIFFMFSWTKNKFKFFLKSIFTGGKPFF
jgi:hypothetical protein